MFLRRLAHRGIGAALALTALAAMAQAQGIATRTTLAEDAQQIAGRAVPAYAATVRGEDGSPASGIVTLVENGRPLASAALDPQGNAEILFDGLASGEHTLHAVYGGDAAHTGSRSGGLVVHPEVTSGAPDFSLTITPTALPAASQPAIVPGDSGDVTATITSLNQFTGFLSLSCAGPPISAGSSTDNAMPVGVSCTFTPANLEMTAALAASSNPSITSALTVQTTAPSGAGASNRPPGGVSNRGRAPLVLAILLPGLAALGLLGRKRKLFGRVALVLLAGAVAVLGTTACNPRYRYLHHPPTYNPGTTPGAYTLTVWAQTSNGVNASEHFTTLGLTVK